MAYSHCMGTGSREMGPNMLHRNPHTGLRQGQEPGPIVSYCAGSVTCPVPTQCEY